MSRSMTSVPDIKLIRTDTFLLRGRISQHSLHKWLAAIRFSTEIRLPPGGGEPKGPLFFIFLLYSFTDDAPRAVFGGNQAQRLRRIRTPSAKHHLCF